MGDNRTEPTCTCTCYECKYGDHCLDEREGCEVL